MLGSDSEKNRAMPKGWGMGWNYVRGGGRVCDTGLQFYIGDRKASVIKSHGERRKDFKKIQIILCSFCFPNTNE